MRTKAKRHIENCKKCGESIGCGICSCQQLALKDRMPLKEDVFFWRLVFSVRQFMDYKSHMALMATCRDLYSIYQDGRELWRSRSHFAFPFTIRDGVGGWHRNPMIATISAISLKVINGVLFYCSELDSSEELIPHIAKRNSNFKQLSLPDNIQGNIAGVVVIADRSQQNIRYHFVIWTEKNEIYTSNAVDYRGMLGFGLNPRLNASAGKIKTIKLSGVILTDLPNNNIRTGNSDILFSINEHCIDAIRLSDVKFLLLTQSGKILVCKRETDNHENIMEILTDLTSENHIIGIAFCMGQILAWSKTAVFAYGRKKHPDCSDENIIDFSQLTRFCEQLELPRDIGEISQVSAGRDHILLLNNRGEVYSAGYNYAKQLGRKISSRFSFMHEEDFDQKFRRVENLPDSIVAMQTGGHDNRNRSSKSLFLTSTGKIYLCGNGCSASDFYSPKAETSSGFLGAP